MEVTDAAGLTRRCVGPDSVSRRSKSIIPSCGRLQSRPGWPKIGPTCRVDRYSIAIIAGQLAVGAAERQLYLWLSYLDQSRFEPVVVTVHPDCGDHWESAIESITVIGTAMTQRQGS